MDRHKQIRRFSDMITSVNLGMAGIMDEEAGTTSVDTPGFSFADDNYCLMKSQMYEIFGFPVLQKVFSRYSPMKNDKRYQHSDSAMGHLLPILGRLDLNGVNLGPTVLIPEIRKHLPGARIDGCIFPMAFMRNDSKELEREVRRECADALNYNA